MNQQTDRLFKEKLEGFRKPAPANAWARVESQLDKKKNKAIWLRIAAAIVFIMAATAALYVFEKTNPDSRISKTLPARPESELPTESKLPGKSNIDIKHQISVNLQKESNGKKLRVAHKKRMLSADQVKDTVNAIEKTTALDLAIGDISLPVPENAVESIHVTAQTTPVNEVAQADAGLKIIYTSQEVDEKYLDKKALAQATSEEKKPSTLRKLLEKAYSLKHNQDPLGELRQKKNEILALDFKREKQRSQNR
jgi:hypothetical protein